MTNHLIPFVAWVQTATIISVLIFNEAYRINDMGGKLALILMILSTIIFLLPYIGSKWIKVRRRFHHDN